MKRNTTMETMSEKTILIVASALLLCGCGKEEIKVYSVPKEIPPAIEQMAADTNGSNAHNNSHAGPLHWTTPSGWKELAPTSMRIGNFLITKGDKTAEVSIITFPGNVGTELDNVNRWRGEIALEPITEDKIISSKALVGSEEGKLYDINGDKMQTIAVVLPKNDASWFFKLRGDKTVVAESKAVFLQFLQTIHFHNEGVAQAEPVAAVPTAVEPVSTGETKWEAPANWVEKPATEMVLKNYSATDDTGHEAKISISSFPGTVGGTLGNVNRWRRQLGLEEISDAQLPSLTTSIDVLGGTATLVDMKGADARMVAAIVPRGGKTWFYKLMGDETVVAKEKEAFTKFVQNVRYSND